MRYDATAVPDGLDSPTAGRVSKTTAADDVKLSPAERRSPRKRYEVGMGAAPLVRMAGNGRLMSKEAMIAPGAKRSWILNSCLLSVARNRRTYVISSSWSRCPLELVEEVAT
jgi:hypothetical protein